jgi:putative endonuclease
MAMQITKHIERGKFGELLAAKYLRRSGFYIKYRNWRHKRCEIDIIAEKNGVIHFVEVKTRYSTTFGYPEESVSLKKFNTLRKGAAAFLSIFEEVKNIQFDVLSISILPGQEVEYFFIEDVYIY